MKYLVALSGFLPVAGLYWLFLLLFENYWAGLPDFGLLEWGFIVGALAGYAGLALVLRIGLGPGRPVFVVMGAGTVVRVFTLLGWALFLYQSRPQEIFPGLIGFAVSVLVYLFFEIVYLLVWGPRVLAAGPGPVTTGSMGSGITSGKPGVPEQAGERKEEGAAGSGSSTKEKDA